MGTKLGWGGLADWAVRWGQGALLGLLAISGAEHVSAAQTLVPVTGGDDGFRLVKVAEGLEHPWGLASLPDGNFLVTERPGRLRLIRNGVVDPQPIAGLPEIASVGQGGLLDVTLHPRFRENGWIYLSYVAGMGGRVGTEVMRARWEGGRLRDQQLVFKAEPKSHGGRHFGSRLVFGPDGYLYITVGDRGDQVRAQRLDDHAGSVIRLRDDGDIPDDNPFLKRQKNVKPEIYSYGHRNPQGMAVNPFTGDLWIHEHGPQGGDEINVIRPGHNYGWPIITYGVNYGTGTPIGEGTHRDGMTQPLYYWVPSIAPSGMCFYNGDRFPDWRGNLFVGSLKFGQLVRLQLKDGVVVGEERLLGGKLGRIRDVECHWDGNLYLLTDEPNGGLYRLEPSNGHRG